MDNLLTIRRSLEVKATPQRPATPNGMESIKKRGIVVFSGGSAANSLVDVFRNIAVDKKCQLSYVIPISDNGGSSSELIRMFGGPGMRRQFKLI
jgi:hypothetical protein